MTNATRYEEDVVAWASEQARLLRERRFDLLDIAHLAEEIKDVGKSEQSEQRELTNRMALLLAHLLKWQMQPGRRGASWQITIRNQRRGILRRLQETPSLLPKLDDPTGGRAFGTTRRHKPRRRLDVVAHFVSPADSRIISRGMLAVFPH
jgi:hypothetical protein